MKEYHEDFRLKTDQIEGQSHEDQVHTDLIPGIDVKDSGAL